MIGVLNQTFDSVWGKVEYPCSPAGREALRGVFLAGAATVLDELRKGVEADVVAGAVKALKGLEAELDQFIGKEVVQ